MKKKEERSEACKLGRHHLCNETGCKCGCHTPITGTVQSIEPRP